MRNADDSLSLRYGVFRPDPKILADRFVVLLNGRTEYLEKYNYFVKDLNLPANCHLLTTDHRGQGASGGARGHIDSYETFCKDTAHIIAKVIQSRPYIIFAHSMGGLITMYGNLHGYFTPQNALLFAPLFGLRDKPIPRPLARLLSAGASDLGVGHISAHFGHHNKAEFEDNRLTHHAARYERIKNAPHQIPSVTFGWVHATFKAIDAIFDPEKIRNLSMNLGILGSPEDKVVDATAWQRWIQTASPLTAKPIEFELIHGAKHELLSEINPIYNYTLGHCQKILKQW